jgi:ferredoxin-fold anticodon binding domain-containing protein
MTNIERAVKELQDNLIVISKLQKRQSELLKIHNQRLVLLESESAKYRRRTDKSLADIATNLEEMTDYKLNGLIGYVSGQRPPSPPKSN